MSIRMQVFISTGICIVLSLVINLGMVRITRGVAQDASHSELAARVTLFAERWVNHAFLFTKDPNMERRQALETTMQGFESALTLMRNGGDASTLISSDEPVPPIQDPHALELLASSSKRWQALNATTMALLASGAGRNNVDALRTIERQSAAVTATAGQLSAYLAKKTQSAADFMVIIEIVALALCLCAGLVVLDVGRRLTGAITRLTRHADRVSMGRSDEPIPARGPGEIALLAKSIDRMRVSLQKSLRMLHQS